MLDFVADCLAVHRLTRIIVTDTIADRPRAHILNALHVGGYDRAVEGLRCSWCTGVWVAVGVGVARAVAPRAWGAAARVLATADVAGIVASFV